MSNVKFVDGLNRTYIIKMADTQNGNWPSVALSLLHKVPFICTQYFLQMKYICLSDWVCHPDFFTNDLS